MIPVPVESPRSAGLTAFAASVPLTIIRPRSGWRAADLREFWRYRELLYFLVWRDIKVQYKQTVVGAAWVILQPVVSTVVFSLVFGQFAGVPSEGLPYPLFVFAGLLPWTLFSKAVSQASLSLVSQTHLITKTYFPRLLVPTASGLAGLVDFALNMAVYGGVMLWYGYQPGAAAALLPALVVITLMLALGLGYVLASLTLAYRDFKFVVPFMLQVWMYISPVIYPVSLLPPDYRWLITLNPLTGIIGAFRGTLLDRPVDWLALLYAAVVALGIFAFGLYSFRRAESRFADIA